MRTVIINDTEETLDEKIIGQWTQVISGHLSKRQILKSDMQSKELSLVFLKDVDAKNLNWNHRQKDYPTDVLSFITDDPEGFGEVVFCPSVIHRQAKENKHGFYDELGYLILHGCLHLLGFDHEKDPVQGEKMLDLQDEIFEDVKKEIYPPKATRKAKAKPLVIEKKSITLKKSSKTAKAVIAKKAKPMKVSQKAATSAKKSPKKAPAGRKKR